VTPVPDTVGFAAAQDRLRQQLGVDAVFIVPTASVWPAGTELDPETGKPYDPFLEPESGGEPVEETVRCSYVHKPLALLDPAQAPIGDVDRGVAALIVPVADYSRVRTAVRVRVGDEVYDVQQFRQDIFAGYVRWIADLEHA
jgi:hypothetical protein